MGSVCAHTKHQFLDVLIVVYLLITAGGLFTTVTHQTLPFVSPFTDYSYGMLAPYQGDDDQNIELSAVGTDASGATTLVPIDHYFPGQHAERNVRQLLQIFIFDSERKHIESLLPFLTQILDHERRAGRPYRKLDLYQDQWQRSPEGYDALRMHATHTFLLSVR